MIDDPQMVDANAVAGELRELFGRELTVAVCQCANCGNRAAMGSLRAWVKGPGVVLRCSICSEIVLRWSRTPNGVRMDLRGAQFMAIPEEPTI